MTPEQQRNEMEKYFDLAENYHRLADMYEEVGYRLSDALATGDDTLVTSRVDSCPSWFTEYAKYFNEDFKKMLDDCK